MTEQRTAQAETTVTGAAAAQAPRPWWRAEPLAPQALAALAAMESRLRERIVGQDGPVAEICRVIRRAALRLHDPRRPGASFLLMGPTGVGKTDVVKALALYLNGDEEAMERLDMSEFHDQYQVARLVGSPPGYLAYEEGGQLTNALLANPYALVLLDEVEKAHPRVFDILLQILADGRLTDGHGRTVSCREAIFVLTSNVGAQEIQRHIGDPAALEAAARRAAAATFRPELLNRLDGQLVVRPLTPEAMQRIVRREFRLVRERIEQGQRITVRVTDAALDALARDGYDPAYGARPLTRLVERIVADTVADGILAGQFRPGDIVGLHHGGVYRIQLLQRVADTPQQPQYTGV